MDAAAEKRDASWGSRWEDWSELAAGAGGVLMVLGAVIFGWQAYTWLQSGAWPSLSGFDLWRAVALPEPSFSWPGAQQLVAKVLKQQLALDCVAVGAFLAWVSDLKFDATTKGEAK